MNPIYIYSGKLLRIDGAPEPDIVFGGGYYRYTLYSDSAAGEPTINVTDFIFEAIVHTVVDEKLRAKSYIDTEEIKIFSRKVSTYLYLAGCKSKIDGIIKSLLTECNSINLDGVIKFRMKEFSSDISAFFEMLFYERGVQKRYDDFVSLLRCYIELESPCEPVIHIVFGKTGFMLYNAAKTNITATALKKYQTDMCFHEGGLNDFLISSLLYFLPKNIVIHINDGSLPNISERRIIETIKAIFRERVTACEDKSCELCGGVCKEVRRGRHSVSCPP